MNCPTCKNPIQNHSKICEWCGSDILSISDDLEKLNKHTQHILRIVFEGEWFLIDAKSEIYINGILTVKGSVKNGFQFEIENVANLPIIKIKTSFRSQTLELPPLETNKSYLIEIEYSRFWGNYCAKPKAISQMS